MDDLQKYKAAIMEHLQKSSLRDFIIWLDTECCKVKHDHFLYQVMVRGLIALGDELLNQHVFKKDHPIHETIWMEELYALEPTEENWDKLQWAATRSFPFGPGDGCFSLPGSAFEHGVPGDGCRSGAGSLASQGIKDERVMELLREELIPWLNGDDDPVISKNRRV